MSKAEFVYAIYIATTPEKLWNALTDPEITRQYWSHANISDWNPGSAWEHRRADGSAAVDIAGTVVESAVAKELAHPVRSA